MEDLYYLKIGKYSYFMQGEGKIIRCTFNKDEAIKLQSDIVYIIQMRLKSLGWDFEIEKVG